MEIIISNSSDLPIYEQIARQIKDAILVGTLREGQSLPSIRSLANDLRVSVITTKRAYAELEQLGFIDTVQGKGSFVSGGNMELLREEQLRNIEQLLEKVYAEAKTANLSIQDIHEMIDVIASEN
ncbi:MULTISPECIES: GntR family transcriptional regulator [unclassified Adlercreutzia]|uniref:GntR family transcriptional regulator n=1 Tax=unclassified Adlercreutzia TaxID=2636013 RepID=UPI0013EB6A48|nr:MULTISPECIES: GntR family transcriptional regulator [unclassified Adlercreutzia]